MRNWRIWLDSFLQLAKRYVDEWVQIPGAPIVSLSSVVVNPFFRAQSKYLCICVLNCSNKVPP
jgi:hypothetical protein